MRSFSSAGILECATDRDERSSRNIVRVRFLSKIALGLSVLSFALTTWGCGSRLIVEPDNPSATADIHSVPFYLPRQDFVVTNLALDEKGNEVGVDRRGFQVSLVTRRDPERAFFVRNQTGPFSASEFSITRDQLGRMTAITGKTEDKSLETVQAIASLVVTAAAFASGKDRAEQDLIDEKSTLKAVEKGLLAQLASATTAKDVSEIQKALEGVRGRIAAIDGILAGATGTKAFGTHIVNTEICGSETDRDARISQLKNANHKGVYVFLIAADGKQGASQCY